jgi:hypothetical protein
MKIITRGHREPRHVRVKLDDGSLVTGKINLIQRGHVVNRLSDIFVGRDEPFVVVYEATLEDRMDLVLVINKQHIVWVMPEEEEFKGRDLGLEFSY